MGGTWHDNTYPGCGCDVPSHLYSFSFAPKTDWTRRYAEQPEILSYAEDCVERFGLGTHLRLDTTVDRARFDDDRGDWELELVPQGGAAEVLRADTVVFACGQLNRPAHPRHSTASRRSPGHRGIRPDGTTGATSPASGSR